MSTESETVTKYGGSDIRKFFADANIFMTGGSGFLGNLLIQKLIRECPEISNIYLLLRQKKGKTSNQRLLEIFDDPVFDRMKIEYPQYNEKIHIINGDCEEADLGLNEKDKGLLCKQINIIFHMAATVRFDEKLTKAAHINVRATRDLVILAKTINNLKAFVHFSTAYSHCVLSEVDEKFYDVPVTGKELLQIVDSLKEEYVDILTPKLLGNWPNTYTFTKAIAENCIQDYGRHLPICIIRPSMIISTHSDPVDAWINNLYGPVSMALAGSLGLVRVYNLHQHYKADLVPADFVVHSAIAACWNVGKLYINNPKPIESNIVFDNLETKSSIPIFNYISSNENPITWKEYGKYVRINVRKWQTEQSIWLACLICFSNYYICKFVQIFLHYIPAYLIDGFLFLTKKKPRLVKIYKKINTFENSFSFFALRQWKFNNNNTQELWKKLNNIDKDIYKFNMKVVKWDKYFKTFGKGLRIYILKDPLETLPQGLAKHTKLVIMHYTFLAIVVFILLKMFYGLI